MLIFGPPRLVVTTNECRHSLPREHRSLYSSAGVWRSIGTTLIEAYSGVEVLCCSVGVVLGSMGMRPNNHENRSGLLPSFQEALRAA